MDARLWRLPAERAKNDHAHIVPLNELAIAELTALDTWSKQLEFLTQAKELSGNVAPVVRYAA